MDPTNPMFAKFDQALGKTTPTTSSGPVSSRADEIRALGRQTPAAPAGNVLSETADNYGSNINPAVQDVEGGGNIGGAVSDFQKGNILGGVEKSTLGVASDAVKAIFAPIAAPLQTLIAHANTTIDPNKTVSGEEGINSPQAQQARASIGAWAKAHPDLSQTLTDALNVGGAALGSGALDTTVSDAVSSVKNAVSDTAGGIKNTVTDATDAAKAKISGAFKGKTPEEILATPEANLPKLSPQDRKVYFDAQRDAATQSHTAAQDAITQKSTQMESVIKADAEKKMTALNDETQGLVNKADRASIEEAQSLKPKVIQSMGKNSATYRDLIDKEIAPVRDEEITHDDLSKYITNRNLDNPNQAAELEKRLGLSKGAKTTVGEIYDQLKSLKQDIGKPATKGARTFTPDEMKTTNAIAVLSDYLKTEKGIDFTEANKFWSQYAPMRDKLIKSVQPFTPRGAESATFNTFSKDIQNYVSRVKEGKVDFIAATEKLLGTKIGNSETRAALEKLTANQKAKIATKLEEENKLSDAKLLREKQAKSVDANLAGTKKAIDDKEFEADRKAQTRANVWKAIKYGTGGIVGLEELKRLTGI